MRTPRLVAQVTHSLSAYSGLELYSNLTESEIDTMWERVPGQREIARTHGLGTAFLSTAVALVTLPPRLIFL